ncbi:MAG: glycosyltransferase [Bacteroidia bacterium]
MKELSHLSIVIGSLRMGGAERAAVNLANEFSSRGIRTDVVMVNAEGEFMNDLSPSVRVVDLHAGRTRKAGNTFAKYLKSENPQIIIAIQAHVQLMVMMSIHRHRLRVPVILNEQSMFSVNVPVKGFRQLVFRLLARHYFPMAAAVTAVSSASALDFTRCFPEMNGKVDVIYNPVITGINRFTEEPAPDHPFFRNKNIPVVISAGRLTESKDFPTLLKAIAIVREKKEVNLIILGEGEMRESLLQLSHDLHIQNAVSLQGFIPNPMLWMNYADVFVLSSKYEGLPFVMVEAMAAGCSVISTDCPGGSSEVLENGRYGTLVPVSAPETMADALFQTLSNRTDKNLLQQRAREFSAVQVVNNYMDLIQKILPGNA